MRAITKEAEPASLTQHRKTPHSDYGNYPDKDGLRVALVAEQRGLCCYCMGRIRGESDKMKIEHWHCQTNYPDEQLVYRNLLGACPGGEGQPQKRQHCDTRKGDQDLLWNPADPDHHVQTRLSYREDGTIKSNHPEFDRQLNEVLNLNLPRLKNSRKGVLDGILSWWRKVQQPVPKSLLVHEIAVRSIPYGNLTPYSQIAIWWLEKKIAEMPQ